MEACTYLLYLNFSRILDIATIIMYEGTITAKVAITAPKKPDVVYPQKVATFMPTGPGVTEDIAIIFASCSVEYHFCVSAIWYKNGIVAYPPPKENKPT